MAASEIAPYATARTSILVYKGKGILVKRAQSRDEAILDAISEFNLQASLHQIYLTSYVGAQGQEVEISRSAFAFVRDTIPIHVHLREEDDSAERPRWPALPLAGLAAQDSPRPEPPPPPPRAPAPASRLPYFFGLGGGEGSRISESKVESMSDWQRNSSGTPDTTASIHRPTLSKPEHHSQMSAIPRSPEEMLSEKAMNSLINGYIANPNSTPASLPTESVSSSLPSNNAGKAWNWFKRAGTAIAGPASTTQVQSVNKSGPQLQGSSEKPTIMSVKTSEAAPANLPQRPSRDNMQNHRHTLSRVKQVSQIPQADQVTEEIKTLLREDSFPSVMVEVPVALRVNKIRPEKVADDDDNWGPGGLVVDGVTEARTSTKLSEAPSNSPWWAKPTDTLDAKTSKKLGLKPLQLQKSDVRTHNETSKHASSQSSKQLETATAMKEVGHERQLQQQLERGRVSPGQPKTGRRRRKTSRNISRDTTGPSQRPLPADIPESPFSARRFTRHDVRLDTLRSNHRPSRSKLSNNVGEGFPVDADARDEVYQTSALPKPAQPKSPERVQHPLRPLGSKIAAADKFSTISAASHETFGDQRHVPLRRTALEEEPLPTVPVATLPPAKLHSSDSVDKNRGGTFAAAAQAARRQLTARERDRNGIPAKRTSLSSLRDFVAAEIPDDRQSQAKEHARVNKGSEVSEDDGDDQEEEEASVVNVERLVLGPMDLTSPNRKGSKLVLKAKLELCELSLEWQPEKKVILSVPFDAIRTLQLPEPGCRESFLIIKPAQGEVRIILVEMDEESLLSFQRYVLVFIAGLGADVEHLSAGDFHKISHANGW